MREEQGGGKAQACSWDGKCATASFLRLELRRDHKEGYLRVGESKGEMDNTTVDKIRCSLEGC